MDAIENDRVWNSSVEYLQRVERRQENADLAKIEGNPVAFFRSTELIYQNTFIFFSEAEKKECEDFIDRCEDQIKSMRVMGKGVHENAITGIEQTCDKLRMVLNKLLHKYKIMYYTADHKTIEQELEDDFRAD